MASVEAIEVMPSAWATRRASFVELRKICGYKHVAALVPKREVAAGVTRQNPLTRRSMIESPREWDATYGSVR